MPQNEAYLYYKRAEVEGQPLWSYYFPNLKHRVTQNTVGNAIIKAALAEEARLHEKREAEREQKKLRDQLMNPKKPPPSPIQYMGKR